MLLERLEIENYGVYEGRSEFDLSTSKKKPIVLVGGMNGAGKTTIFESLMIALYGKAYLGRRATRKEYLGFVAKKLHTHHGRRASSASISVSFRFYHNGCEDTYQVHRGWNRDGASIEETFVIKKNGKTMTEVDESQWQSFLEGLLPLGIAKLFFFDGEKIVRMTKWDESGNDEIKTSLDMLMGTSLIERLSSDLDLYMVRKSGKGTRDGADSAIRAEYDALKKEKEQVASDIEMMQAESERKKVEMEELTQKVGSKELKVAGLGGGYADIRGKLLTKKAVLDEKTRQQAKVIHEALSGDAPLYMVPSLLSALREQMDEDMRVVGRQMSASMIKEGLERFRKEMLSGTFWPDGADGKSLSELVSGRLDDIFENKGGQDGNVFFDMSFGDMAQIIAQVSEFDRNRESLCLQTEEYAKTRKDYDKTESDLAKVPRDDELGPHISKINAMHQDIGILKSEVAHLDQQISSKQAYLRILKNKIKGLIDSIYRCEKADAGMHIASKMKDVLDTYSASLKERKVCELESNLVDAMRTLLHKKHIGRIAINRETFEIRVYEHGDHEDHDILKSMGERQMVGTALLWAIAKTSGRSLPFVIDTPLGRLDGKHLSNLTGEFYPYASHQLILLSTDREIGPKEYKQLLPYTSRSYKITCNEDMSITTVSDGYFTEKDLVQT